MSIPVVVVDDNQTDRYILRRRLSQADDFDLLDEMPAGDTFIDTYLDNGAGEGAFEGIENLLILLDINMPRMNGFQTVEEIERRQLEATGLDSCVVLMCTTSASPEDRAEAERHPLIKGYFVKPLSARNIEEIRDIYHRGLADRHGQ